MIGRKSIFLLAVLITTSIPQVALGTYITLDDNRHQLKMDIANIFRFVSNDHRGFYQMYYRYNYKDVSKIRLGMTLALNTSRGTRLENNISIGLEREFKKTETWSFARGFDIVGGIEKTRAASRWTYNGGIQASIIIEYRLASTFSISMEPGLFFNMKFFKDYDTFSSDDSEFWIELNIINTGRVFIGFHF